MNQINITCIQTYNRLNELSKKNASGWRMRQGKTAQEIENLKASAPLLRFTINKQVTETEKLLIDNIYKFCEHISVSNFYVTSNGFDFVLPADVSTGYIQNIIDYYFSCIVAEKDSTSTEDFKNAPVTFKTRAMGVARFNYYKLINATVLHIGLITFKSHDDTFLSYNSDYYGLHDVSKRAVISSKKSYIVDHNFRLGLLTEASRNPGVCVDMQIKDVHEAIKFVNSVKECAMTPWKAAAFSKLLSETRHVRWPGYSEFKAVIKN